MLKEGFLIQLFMEKGNKMYDVIFSLLSLGLAFLLFIYLPWRLLRWLHRVLFRRTERKKTPRTDQVSSSHAPPFTNTVQHLMPPESEQEAANREFDWNRARAELQKVAYGMTDKNVSEKEKAEFRLFMAHFALHDPLYQEVMEQLKPILSDNPGVTQSLIYKKEDEKTKEMIRYVLYFAEVLGHIRRVKKGSSYQLYLPNQTVKSA